MLTTQCSDLIVIALTSRRDQTETGDFSIDEKIAGVRQKILSTRLRLRALRRQSEVVDRFLFAAVIVIFGLIGGLSDAWNGAISFMVMFLVFSAIGTIVVTLIARSR
jgi:hypothetical protein